MDGRASADQRRRERRHALLSNSLFDVPGVGSKFLACKSPPWAALSVLVDEA